MKKFISTLVFMFLLAVASAAVAPQGATAPEAAAPAPLPGGPAATAPADIGPKNTSGTATPSTADVPQTGNVDSHDPLLDVPPLPKGKATLIGGTVAKIDRVRNTIVVNPYGGQHVKLYFDERTRIFRDGTETTQMGIKKGERVYVDTMLDGSRVFAKNIRVETEARQADAHGQLLAYDPRHGRLAMRDQLTAEAVTFRVTPETVIKHGTDAGTFGDLLPGSIIDVKFAPDKAKRGVARQVTVLATPGSRFSFSGTVTFVDMRQAIVALDNRTDGKTYEVHFDPHSGNWQNVVVGSEATIDAVFDGSKYNAVDLNINSVAQKKED